MCHMKTISLRELHAATGAWVRRAMRLGTITITDRGKPIAKLTPITSQPRANLFLTRKLRPGYARLLGKLGGGSDSTAIVSEDRDRR